MSLIIKCPCCGKRNGYEFRFGGEDKKHRPSADELTPEKWFDHIHLAKNAAGIQKEWWYHRDGCGLWFTIFRDTEKNRQVDEAEVKNETTN